MGSAGEDIIGPAKEVDWMRRLSAAIGRPVTFALLQVDADPGLWRELMDESLRAADEGAELWPQVAGRATGLLGGPPHHLLAVRHDPRLPAAQGQATCRPPTWWPRCATPRCAAPIVEWEPPDEPRRRRAHGQELRHRPTCSARRPHYEPGPERSLAVAGRGRRAARRSRWPTTPCSTTTGEALLYVPILNYSSGNLDPTRQMLLHPRAALGLADGGAHCGVICDAGQPTFMLSYWTRDRTQGEKLPLEWVVRKQTRDTARLYGLGDRGTIEVGMVADLNVIDYEHLQLGNPVVVDDLPAGGKRLVQRATGYEATIKSGVTTFADGEDTGERARVACSAAPAEAAAASRNWARRCVGTSGASR